MSLEAHGLFPSRPGETLLGAAMRRVDYLEKLNAELIVALKKIRADAEVASAGHLKNIATYALERAPEEK